MRDAARTPRWWCDYCGTELTPTAAHLAHVRWFGVAPERPPCPASENGRHGCNPVKVSMGLQKVGGGYVE